LSGDVSGRSLRVTHGRPEANEEGSCRICDDIEFEATGLVAVRPARGTAEAFWPSRRR
jgi:hypothetical protein